MIGLSFVLRNIIHYWRTNIAVVIGVAVAVAVLAGALLVGSSVRSSLRSLALERLGSIDYVITSLSFVRESLAKDLKDTDGIREQFPGVVPLVAIEGFVTHQASGRRASDVQVYGVDERFWRFHGVDTESYSLGRNTVFISSGLAREFEVTMNDSLLVRIEKPSAVPISSLYGRRDDVGRTLRLDVVRVLEADELGEFSFRPQQGFARSVFVSLERLQSELGQENHVNTFLLGGLQIATEHVFESDRLATVEEALRAKVSLHDLGLRVRVIPNQGTVSVESSTGLLAEDVVGILEQTADDLGMRTEPVLTYLVNQIRSNDQITPYSLVSALDLNIISEDYASPEQYKGASIILNQWIADDLQVVVGDSLTLEYFIWEDEGRLSSRETEFRIVDVVPIKGAASDPELAPDYPGITEVNNVIDWDPPFEVDLNLIRKVDEDYWDDYRTTPKAFIPLIAGQQMWASRWGQLTSVRIVPGSNIELESLQSEFSQTFRKALDPLSVGFVVYPARSLALEASVGTTDFGLYFIYFSFFLVVSALLLASLFFRLGVEQRLREIGLLRAIGYPVEVIRRVFQMEGVLLSVLGGAVGVVGAVLYADLIMWGLRTWWVDAVGTTRLLLAVSPLALGTGVMGGVVAACVSITVTLRTAAFATPRSLLSGAVAEVAGISMPQNDVAFADARAWKMGIVFGALGIVLVCLSGIGFIGATGGFFGSGVLVLCALLFVVWGWFHSRPRRHTVGPWSLSQVGFRNASYRPGRSVLCIALIASASFIIVSVDAFRLEGADNILDNNSGSGGFTLLADTLLPLVHDPSTIDGQQGLFISDLFTNNQILDGVSISRFRVRPGEDASCLNLYQAKDPRILAPTSKFVDEARFSFGATVDATPKEKENPWLLLERRFTDGAIPAIADSTSLAYALHLSIGDDLVLNRDTDHPIRLRIVAALTDSIFQRELLISEAYFNSVFNDYEGYRFFLIDAPLEQTAEVSLALEDRMADFGFDVVSTTERLAAFHRVNNTYLATFQTLGGFGLILGTFGLGAVLLRNVLERRKELSLMRAVGFNIGHLSLMVLAENTLLLLAGLSVGTVSAVVAIAPALFDRGGTISLFLLSILFFIVIFVGLVVSFFATIVAIRSPLLASLRTD